MNPRVGRRGRAAKLYTDDWDDSSESSLWLLLRAAGHVDDASARKGRPGNPVRARQARAMAYIAALHSGGSGRAVDCSGTVATGGLVAQGSEARAPGPAGAG